MRPVVRHALCMAGAAVLLVPSARAQSWRTLDAARQRQGADSLLHVRVRYGAGAVSLGAARPELLYDMHVRYDADRLAPSRHFDAAGHTLSIGLNNDGQRHVVRVRHELASSHSDAGKDTANAFTLALAREMPLDLELELGAVEAKLDLSNLWLDRLVLRSGASDVKLSFGTPNPRRLHDLEILGGAASISVSDLGNSNAAALRVRAGAASVDLDFSGAWAEGDMRVDLDAAFGDATLHVPEDVGVRITMQKLLADLDGSGLNFTRRNGAYYSANWDSAPHKLTINARAALGDLTVRRTAQ